MMKYVKKAFSVIVVFFSGVIAALITNILRHRGTTSEDRTTVEQLRGSSERLERDSERVGQSCNEIRQTLDDIRTKQKVSDNKLQH